MKNSEAFPVWGGNLPDDLLRAVRQTDAAEDYSLSDDRLKQALRLVYSFANAMASDPKWRGMNNAADESLERLANLKAGAHLVRDALANPYTRDELATVYEAIQEQLTEGDVLVVDDQDSNAVDVYEVDRVSVPVQHLPQILDDLATAAEIAREVHTSVRFPPRPPTGRRLGFLITELDRLLQPELDRAAGTDAVSVTDRASVIHELIAAGGVTRADGELYSRDTIRRGLYK
jgi:hypothetical protein